MAAHDNNSGSSGDPEATAACGVPKDSGVDPGDQLNTSLDEVLDLLAEEVERLKESLEFYRLSEHPEKEQLIRWVVQQIDMRQDRLEDIKAMILARDDDAVH
jgi:hypothetical protein